MAHFSHADCEQERWDSFAELMHPLSSKVAWMTVAGNHEVEDCDANTGEQTTERFLAYSHRYGNHQPFEASGSDDLQWYSFEAAGVHFTMLGSYADYGEGSPQLEWLSADLAAVNRSRTPFIVAVLHSPWYNSNSHHHNETEEFFFAQAAEPLLRAAAVDLVLAGHVHAYERSYPAYQQKRVTSSSSSSSSSSSTKDHAEEGLGTVYVTVGDGGNREGHAWPWLYPQPEWSAYRESSFGHGLLTVVNDTAMHWTWRRNHGDEAAVNDEAWFFAH
jgi:hypothetical protein